MPPVGRFRLILGLLGSLVLGFGGIAMLSVLFDVAGRGPNQPRPDAGEVLIALGMAVAFLWLAFLLIKGWWKNWRLPQSVLPPPHLEGRPEEESAAAPPSLPAAAVAPPLINTSPAAWDSYPTSLKHIEDKCGEEDIRVLSGSFFRVMGGPGQVRFGTDEMVIECKFHANPWPLPLYFPYAFLIITGIPEVYHGKASFGPYGFFGGLCLVIYFYLARGNELRIRRENLAHVLCHGPMVTMAFSKSPVSGLRKMNFFVNRPRRREFFEGFAQVFPGVLPASHGLEPQKADAAGQATPAHTPTLPKVRSNKAIWSLILGILFVGGPFTGVQAVICGHMALGEIKRADGGLSGRGLALAGLILGYLTIGYFAVVMSIVIFSSK